MNSLPIDINSVYQEIIREINIYKPTYRLNENQFYFDYSESNTIKEYFTQQIQPTLFSLFNESEFLTYSLDLYPRRQLFVFTDILYKKISKKNDAYLASILYAVWSYLLWVDDTVDQENLRERKKSMTIFSQTTADAFLGECINTICKYLGLQQGERFKRALRASVTSMKHHNKLLLYSHQDTVIRNYFERGATYITWPTTIIAGYAGDEGKKRRLYLLTHAKHVGSQIMNDIRDIYTQRYSDLMNHQSTIPLLILFYYCNGYERDFLMSIYGKQVTKQQVRILDDIIREKSVLLKSQFVATSILKLAENNVSLLGDQYGLLMRQWLHKFYIR